MMKQEVRASAGTVTLSTEASLVASAVTSGTSFDLRSIKPGMLVDATVERVLSYGIVVRMCLLSALMIHWYDGRKRCDC